MTESTIRLPEQVDEFTIHPLYCGTIRNHERSGFLYRTDCGGARLNAPCIAWLLRGQTEILLVDTGPGTRTRAGRFYTDDENREDLLLDELLRLDVDPSSLTRVILTHLHNDHVGGAPLLQNARFYVQKAELTEAV